MELQPLPLPAQRQHDPVESDPREIDALWRVPAVALFADRAGSALPRTAEAAGVVAKICVHLDGLPLAIELAAARLADHTPEEILAKLDRGLGILADPRRRLTLQDSLATSYALLPPQLQRFFVRLSVFVGGFDLDAAVGMAAGWSPDRGYPIAGGLSFHHLPWTTLLGRESPSELGPWDPPALPPLDLDPRQALDELIHRHLVRRAPGGRAQRYELLETIREYGLECLRADGEEAEKAVRHAHAAIMVAGAEAGGVGMTQEDRPLWLARVVADLGNTGAAYDWLAEQADRTPAALQLALRMIDSLGIFWQTTGRAAQGRAWLDAALARPGASAGCRASSLYGTGILAWIQRDLDRADEALAEGERLALQIGFRVKVGRCAFGQGLVAWSRGDFAAMEAKLRAVIDLCDPQDDPIIHGLALVALAIGARAKALGLFGEPEPTALVEATTLIATAYAMFQPVRFGWGMATARLYGASIFRIQGKRGLAVPALREALQGYVKDDDPWGTGAAICNLAVYVAEDGDQEDAARLFGAVAAFQERGGTILPPTELESQTTVIAAIGHKLGAQVFGTHYEDGRRMDPAAAIALALRTETSSRRYRTPPPPDLAPPIELNERQLDLIQRLANGHSAKEIATHFGVKENRVYQLIADLRTKLGALSDPHLVAIALRRGLI